VGQILLERYTRELGVLRLRHVVEVTAEGRREMVVRPFMMVVQRGGRDGMVERYVPSRCWTTQHDSRAVAEIAGRRAEFEENWWRWRLVAAVRVQARFLRYWQDETRGGDRWARPDDFWMAEWLARGYDAVDGNDDLENDDFWMAEWLLQGYDAVDRNDDLEDSDF
jgi:hypothetical protein